MPNGKTITRNLLFTTLRGHPIRTKRFVARYWKPALKKAGLPKGLQLMHLRHTGGTYIHWATRPEVGCRLPSVCQPDDASSDGFDYRRTGLDHFGFKVADEIEFDQGLRTSMTTVWRTHRYASWIFGVFVSFEDPDGTQLELWP